MDRNRGFTLLEVLIASAIAALALAVLFRTVPTALFSVRLAGQYEEAVARAQSHLAALGDAPLLAGTSTGDDGGGFQWRLTIVPWDSPAGFSQTSERSASFERSPAKLYAVEVGISWGEGRGREVVLRSARLSMPTNRNE
jgi:general secretion pathway protein I